MVKPNDGESVWIEYPESKYVRSVYDASEDVYRTMRKKIVPADEVVNWSSENPNKKKASEQPPSTLARFTGGVVQFFLDLF